MSARAPSARQQALERLLRIEEQGAYISRIAGTGADAGWDEARAGRQATEYVAGVTRQRSWLDFLIDHFYRGDPAGLDPVVRQILRIGLYDLLVLGTPPHAAVNEATELARRRARPATGLVNGVLRAVARQREALPAPDSGDALQDLATRHSAPVWMVRRWVERFGTAEATALLRANNTRPRYALRVNSLHYEVGDLIERLGALGVAWEPSPYLDDFVRVAQLQPILRSDLLAEGVCAVQDEAAGLVVRLLDPQPGEVVIDAAAAPGGKAVYAGLRMQDRGRLIAIDVHPGRLGLVRRAAAAHRLTLVETRAADVRELAPGQIPQGDRVLLDAPCSGLGVLAKRADLRWRRSEDDIARLAALQDELLRAASRLVAPGGVLVYSTCTIEPEENDQRVERFLAEGSDFRLEPAHGDVPPSMVTGEGYLLALPHRHGTDGAFAARMRRAP